MKEHLVPLLKTHAPTTLRHDADIDGAGSGLSCLKSHAMSPGTLYTRLSP